MQTTESSRWTARAHRVATTIVVLTGWAALLATTDPGYHWRVASAPLAVDFDLAQGAETARTYVVRVEGHPSLAHSRLLLRVTEPGRDLFDVDAGALGLPIVQAPAPITPWEGYGPGNEREWQYDLSYACTTTPCEVQVLIGARASGANYTRHFEFVAAVDGSDAEDPPPGRVSLELLGAP